MWLIILSDQLPIVALVGSYPANQLIGRGPPPRRDPLLAGRFPPADLRPGDVCGIVPHFCGVSPTGGIGRPRVPHPSATAGARRPLPSDLHVLRTPPAFVLSQDQTLHQMESSTEDPC